MADPELELELEKRFEQQDADTQKDLDPLETRVRVLEEWKAGEDALSTLRRWLLPILTMVATLFLNIGIQIATHKH